MHDGGDRAEQPGAVARTAWRPDLRRCRRLHAARRSRPAVLGVVARLRRSCSSASLVGASSPRIRTSSSDKAWACADRSDGHRRSAPAAVAARAAAAASVASWLSVRARSSCAASSSTSGGGGDAAHAAADTPSSASAAAPTRTRRLLTVGGRLGTCNILPLRAHCASRTPPRVCRLTVAALAYRG